MYFCHFSAFYESEQKKENKTVFMNFIDFKHKILKYLLFNAKLCISKVENVLLIKNFLKIQRFMKI